jgi:hypothetical protein
MIITYTCPFCSKETDFEEQTLTELLLKIQAGSPKACSYKLCKKRIPQNVLRKHFYGTKEFKDKTYDRKKDRYATPTQLYSALEIAQRFNIGMRLDPVVPGTSNVGSVVHVYPCHPNYTKNITGYVSEVKGGRLDGRSVMGCAAREIRKLVAPVDQGTHRDDEWLHLWGDNLGGPSSAKNFVSGSYAANTEMLVIEQALAVNSALTKVLVLDIEAECSAAHFGEYLTYTITNPSTAATPFQHLIDLRNTRFTAADKNTVHARIDAFLSLHGMKVTL